MVYDTQNSRVLLFGGVGESNEGNGDLNDTSAYDPRGNTWTELKPLRVTPCPGRSIDGLRHADQQGDPFRGRWQ